MAPEPPPMAPEPSPMAPEPPPMAPEPPPPSAEAQSPEVNPRVSNGPPAGARLRSRTAGRVWQGRRPTRSRRGLRTAPRRRWWPARSPSDRAKPGSRNVRRLYPPLIVVLLVVVVVALVNRGGGGASTSSGQSGSAPRSVFPIPSTVPTTTPPPVAVPTPVAKQPSVAPQPKLCRPVQVHGRAVSVSILQGQVTCRNARAVVRTFKSGKGRHGGSPGNRYVTVRGWRCLPSGTCTRPGKSIKAS
jgi:hypothetical protein